jgi:hypothetical protein
MLQRPLLTPIVVGFWLVTSGWLVVTKILPSLSPGSPPGQQALYTSGHRPIPVAWTVQWNERPVGWALATSARQSDGGLAVDSRLQFDKLPLDEMIPAWAGLLVRRVVHESMPSTFSARGRLEIDAVGQLREFTSRVRLPGATEDVLLRGTVNDGDVDVRIDAGGMTYETTRHLPTHVMIGDELSPQASLPGLYEGRRWTIPVYSPLRPGHSPIEVLHADVGPEEALYWEDGLVRVHVVAYREDPSSHREPRCRLWVDLSGRVLKQEAMLFGTRMTFLRRTDEAAAWLAEDGGPDAAGERPTP